MKLSSFTRTRKGRVALTAVPAAAAVTLLLAGVANGAVPVSFSVSGTPFVVAASHLHGEGFTQYSGVAVDAKGGQHPLAISSIDTAELTNLCQFVAPDGAPVALKITAGDNGKPATASDLQIGMTDLTGDATFSDIHIGVDASKVRYGAAGTVGDFAQDAKTVDIDHLSQKSLSTKAGTFTLTHLHLFLTSPKDGCPS